MAEPELHLRQRVLLGHKRAPGLFVELQDDGVTILDVPGVVAIAAAIAESYADPALAQQLRDAFNKTRPSITGTVREGLSFQVTFGGKGG